jgi:hypothetical protein
MFPGFVYIFVVSGSPSPLGLKVGLLGLDANRKNMIGL